MNIGIVSEIYSARGTECRVAAAKPDAGKFDLIVAAGESAGHFRKSASSAAATAGVNGIE
jgi:hypothetical protein